MPNLKYRRGADKERRYVNYARAKGWISFRSAGSHSPIDVCMVDRVKKRIFLIQCKPKNFPKSKKEQLESEFKDLNDEYRVFFLVK